LYSQSVREIAFARLQKRKSRREAAQIRRREQIRAAIPELQELERQMRANTPRLLSDALRHGGDLTEALVDARFANRELEERRLTLLTEHGFSGEDMAPSYDCPLCGDTGWQGAEMCHCLTELCKRVQIEELSLLLDLGNQSFDNFRPDYYSEEIYPGQPISPRRNIEDIRQLCRQYAEGFGSFPTRNLFFYGPPGVGKTFLSACVAREVSNRGFSVAYESAQAVFAAFEQQKFSREADNAEETRRLTQKHLHCDLLILDDLGTEMTTRFVHTALYQLINSRLVSEKRTIISSNASPDELRSRYSPQIVSRLEGEYETLPFFGEDIRLLKKAL
jgi:DNA replication protein DnaC